MNAATRAITSRVIHLPVLNILPLAYQKLCLGIMVFLLLLSALAVIYCKDLNRRFFIHVEQIKQQEIMAAEQWTKLLLERGSLLAQPRLQQIAETQFKLRVPQRQEIRFIDSSNSNPT